MQTALLSGGEVGDPPLGPGQQRELSNSWTGGAGAWGDAPGTEDRKAWGSLIPPQLCHPPAWALAKGMPPLPALRNTNPQPWQRSIQPWHPSVPGIRQQQKPGNRQGAPSWGGGPGQIHGSHFLLWIKGKAGGFPCPQSCSSLAEIRGALN